MEMVLLSKFIELIMSHRNCIIEIPSKFHRNECAKKMPNQKSCLTQTRKTVNEARNYYLLARCTFKSNRKTMTDCYRHISFDLNTFVWNANCSDRNKFNFN